MMSSEVGMREKITKATPELEEPEGQTKLPRAEEPPQGGTLIAHGTGEVGAQRGKSDIKGVSHRCPKTKERERVGCLLCSWYQPWCEVYS